MFPKIKNINILYKLKLKISYIKVLIKDIIFLIENKTEVKNILNFIKNVLSPKKYNSELKNFFLQSTFSQSDWFTFKMPIFIKEVNKNKIEKEKIKNILEIGSFEGRSTIFFLNYFIKSNITCVDTWEGSYEQANIQMRNVEKNFDKNLEKYSGRIKKVKDNSDSFFEKNNQKYDFIFIDGYHHRDQVMKDAVNAVKHGSPGCFILFDDYTYRYGGHKKGENPINAINKFLLENKNKIKIIYIHSQILVKLI